MHPMVNPSVVSRPRDAQLEERDSLLKDVTQSVEQATAKWAADRMVHRELPHSGSSCSGNLQQTNTAREFSVHDSAKFHLGNKITVNQVVEKPKGPTREQVVEWVDHLDFETVHETNIEKWQPGTGLWLLENLAFKVWLQEHGKPLWCHGMPGAGKTILSSVVINHIKKSYRESANIGLAYIFCNHANKDQTAMRLVSTLIYQLARQAREISPTLLKMYNTHTSRKTPTASMWEEYNQCLHEVVQQFSKVYFIIDALDECRADDGINLQKSTRLKLLQTLTSFKSSARILVTSRDVSTNRLGLGDLSSIESLEILTSESDIKAYIHARIQSNEWLTSYAAQYEKDIQERSLEKAKGNFLLVQLHMDLLTRVALGRMPGKIKKALKTFSSVLDDAYDIILRNVWKQGEDDIKIARHVFSWLVFTKEPATMTMSMVQRSLCIEEDDTLKAILDKDNEISEEDLIYVCHGLATVDFNTKVIRFIHYTAETYFKRAEIRERLLPKAEEEIAKTCILYLSLDDYLEEALHPLYQYASRNWGHHARQYQDVLKDRIYLLLRSGPQLEASFTHILSGLRKQHLPQWDEEQIVFEPSSSEDNTGLAVQPLHVAAFFGLGTIFRDPLLRHFHIDEADIRGWSPLRWAAIGRSENTARLLMDERANMLTKDKSGQETLFWLLGSRKTRVIHGNFAVYNNARCWIGDLLSLKTARSFATVWPEAIRARTSHSIIVLLLNKLEDINIKRERDGRTLLSVAAQNWQWSVVKELILRGANIDLADDRKITPLIWALYSPRHSLVIEKLEAFDSTCIHVGNSTQTSSVFKLDITDIGYSEREIEPAICSLIGRDVKSVYDIDQRTALSLAAESKFYIVVQKLLQRGANPNSKDHIGMTPLHWASRLPCFEKVLIQNITCYGNAAVRFGIHKPKALPLTYLENMTGNRIERTAQLLLCYGADKNATTASWETPYDLAIWDGLDSISELLLMTTFASPEELDTHLDLQQQLGYLAMLHSMVDRRGIFQILTATLFDEAQLSINSAASVDSVTTFGRSKVLLNNSATINNITAFDESKLYTKAKSNIKQINAFSSCSIYIRDETKVNDMNIFDGSSLSIFAIASVNYLKTYGESITFLYGSTSLKKLSLYEGSHVFIVATASISRLQIFQGAMAHLKGRAEIDNISSFDQSHLVIEDGGKIGKVEMYNNSRGSINYTATAVEAVHTTDMSKLVVICKDGTFRNIEASGFSQIALGGDGVLNYYSITVMDSAEASVSISLNFEESCSRIGIRYHNLSQAMVKYEGLVEEGESEWNWL